MTKRMKRAMRLGSEHSAATPQRRGVALMLVVVAMGTATVLTTAYLVSKDNSAAIGANAQDTAASAWVARSGADLALAVLQTEENWVDDDPEKMLEGFSIAGGDVSVALTDMLGNPPVGNETELAMTVVADVNGVKTVVQRIISIRPDIEFSNGVDPELGEFGVFAVEEFEIGANSRVGPWPASPMGTAGAANNIGVGFTEVSSLEWHNSAKATTTKLYMMPDAQAPLQSMIEYDAFVGGEVLQTKVPVIEPRLPGVFQSVIAWPDPNYYRDQGVDYTPGKDLHLTSAGESMKLVGGTHHELRLEAEGIELVLDGTVNGGDFWFTDVIVGRGAKLLVKGDVTVHTSQDLMVLNTGSIRLEDADSSSLTVYTAGNVLIDNGTIGVPDALASDAHRDVSDLRYHDPSKIRVYAVSSLDGGASTPIYKVNNNSIVVASIHAPSSEFEISDSVLCGKVSARTLDIVSNSMLLYDPALNNFAGFTSRNGPLYQSDGTLIAGLDAALAAFDITSGMDALHTYLDGAMSVVEVPVSVPIGDPTPRDEENAIEKLWPFVAMAIEQGSWVSGDNEERQESLYVPLDPTVFDIDQFYNNGVVNAVHVGQQDLGDDLADTIEDVVVDLGGLLKP